MKKLLRSKTNKLICGVCGGVAEYFGIDPTVIRVLWAIAAFFSFGMAALAYVVCAIIIPLESDVI